MYKQSRSIDLPGGVFARGCSPLGVLFIVVLLAFCGACGMAANRVSLPGTEQVNREVGPKDKPGPCTPLPEDMTVSAGFEGRSVLNVRVTGMLPGREATVFVIAHTETGDTLMPTSVTSAPALGGVYDVTLSPVRLPGAVSYTVKLVHRRGVACVDLDPPQSTR